MNGNPKGQDSPQSEPGKASNPEGPSLRLSAATMGKEAETPVPVSVVCVFNRREVLENCLLKSLAKQNATHEQIMLDNSSGSFRSAAEALNRGGRLARGEYILFAHQDVSLETPDWLDRATAYLNSLPGVGAAGIAGKSGDSRSTISNITHGIPPVPAGGIRVNKPREVQALDECLIIIPISVFKRLEFDAETCDDWHLYAVDYCLSAIKRQYKAYVLPLQAHHLSTGHSISKNYFFTLEKVIKKHRNENEIIYTTIHDWNVNRSIISQRARKKYESIKEKLLESVLNLLDSVGIKGPLIVVRDIFARKRNKDLS